MFVCVALCYAKAKHWQGGREECSSPAMSKPRAVCGPVVGFVRPRGFPCCVCTNIMTTWPYFDNLKFDICLYSGPLYHVCTAYWQISIVSTDTSLQN